MHNLLGDKIGYKKNVENHNLIFLKSDFLCVFFYIYMLSLKISKLLVHTYSNIFFYFVRVCNDVFQKCCLKLDIIFYLNSQKVYAIKLVKYFKILKIHKFLFFQQALPFKLIYPFTHEMNLYLIIVCPHLILNSMYMLN